MAIRPAVVWLRQDLRLSDQPAFAAAMAQDPYQPVVPIFVLDDETPGPWIMGGASRWWLHHSLQALERAIRDRGGSLVLRRGVAIDEILDVATACEARAVFWTRHHEPFWRRAEAALETRANAAGIAAHACSASLLFEPGEITSKSGAPLKVFTPFWKACLALAASRNGLGAPCPAPMRIPAPDGEVRSDDLDAWALLPRKPNWASGLRETWTPGEEGARLRLEAFLDHDVERYRDLRNRPEPAATSRLSPHLHFGEVSPRQVWHATRHWSLADPQLDLGAEAFLREIGWREFMAHTLVLAPAMADEPLQARFAAFPWRDDPEGLSAWQRGLTGYPIVDAGMRELWHTGWMHNRVRMITASFLVKHLLQPWQAGETWFWDTLVDADLASNAGGWQWVAGCGTDAAPYFRVFNPVLQGEKFDPDGAYVRRWVPQLSQLPSRWIHQPWQAPGLDLEAAGVRFGTTYPRPIVDHAFARARALKAFEMVTAAA